MPLNLMLKYIICGLDKGELASSRLQPQLTKLEMRYSTSASAKKKGKSVRSLLIERELWEAYTLQLLLKKATKVDFINFRYSKKL